MKVAVVYQYYQGHGAPGHSLVYELTQFLSRSGHEVSVVSGETGYMRPDMPVLPWFKRIVRRKREQGVDVVRTFTYSELHKSYLGRLLSFISFSLSAPLGLMVVRKPDVVLASSPPIFPMFSVWLVCKLRGIPFVLEVRDLWPASAVQMGILKNRQLIGVMSWMERVLYNHAHRIVALTEGIQADIRGRGWPADKVELVTCGVDFDRLYPSEEEGRAVQLLHGWAGRKIIMYFGAMGEANNLHVVLRAADRMRERGDILFVLVGDGMKRRELVAEAESRALSNVQFLDPVPKEKARAYLAAADLCVVTLRDIPLFDGAIPTKLIDYMACAKPVLCGVRGEARLIVEAAGSGRVFSPDDDAHLSELISDLLSDVSATKEMGRRGLRYVHSQFSAPHMRRRMESILAEVVSEAGVRAAGDK